VLSVVWEEVALLKAARDRDGISRDCSSWGSSEVSVDGAMVSGVVHAHGVIGFSGVKQSCQWRIHLGPCLCDVATVPGAKGLGEFVV